MTSYSLLQEVLSSRGKQNRRRCPKLIRKIEEMTNPCPYLFVCHFKKLIIPSVVTDPSMVLKFRLCKFQKFSIINALITPLSCQVYALTILSVNWIVDVLFRVKNLVITLLEYICYFIMCKPHKWGLTYVIKDCAKYC